MIITGNCIEILPTLDAESVQCCVTSPPYYGLRDYGCAGQIGLEPTPEAYVEKLVRVFREVRQVLRDDGTLWLNLGTSYAGSWGDSGHRPERDGVPGSQREKSTKFFNRNGHPQGNKPVTVSPPGFKPKDLIPIPWMVAMALQADGWVLRQEIIWSKPNPMPESVTDRCTKSHEQIFLFSKAKWVGPEKRQFDFISDQDARWLALFLDTEGNICAKRAKAAGGNDHFGTQICFASTAKELLETAKGIIGKGTVLQRGGTNSPMYYYQLSNIQAADLLYRLYPFLIVKQRQAALGIHLQSVIADGDQERRTKAGRLRGRLRDDDYTEELIRIWASMKQLNHFGNPDLSWLPLPEYGHWDSARYFYDAEAVKEPVTQSSMDRLSQPNLENQVGSYRVPGKTNGPMKAVGSRSARDSFKRENSKRAEVFPGQSMGTHRPDREESTWDLATRNRRSVWTITTKPFKEAHFATFPPEIPEICIKAGSSEKGCCPECGSPWERVVEKKMPSLRKVKTTGPVGEHGLLGTNRFDDPILVTTTGWRPTCSCHRNDLPLSPVPCTVLDPFSGAGTTGSVAERLGRKYIGIELNPAYSEMSEDRIYQELGGLPL